MKLYVLPGSLNSRKPLAVIHHLDLPVEIVPVTVAELHAPAFRAINPNAMAPALVDGAVKLWESNAIGVYLSECTDDMSLFPRNATQRLDILRWLYWEAIHFNGAIGTMVFETVVKLLNDLGETDMPAVARAERDFHRFAPVLDAHLADRKYVVGDTLTYADFAVASCEPYRDRLPVSFAAYPNILRFYDRIADLPAWRKATGRAPIAQAA
jgi:glutathione S-transferase